MRYVSRTVFAFLSLLLFSCEKEAVQTTEDLLVNENGWETTNYSRYEPGDTAKFISDPPAYLILNNYGDALLFSNEGKVWINYSDGKGINKTSSIQGSWELLEQGFQFSDGSTEDLQVDIKAISSSELWIKYEAAGDFFEYKLRPIEL